MKSVLALMLIATTVLAAEPPADPGAPASAVEAWRAKRFGMFIHWGPVSLRGTEIGWSRGAQVPLEEYDDLCTEFNPALFNAEEWAQAAKDAGMRYVVLVTKHHDGFCLWPSQAGDHDVERMPKPRDFVGELSAACRRAGLAFGTYYSTCDWHHPDFPLGSPGGRTKKPDAQIARYVDYLRAQTKELVTQYGPLFTIWFDVPQVVGPEYGLETVRMLRALQPDLMINNRAFSGPDRSLVGDYDTPEQRIGGFQRERPWETCMTICQQWAWRPNDGMKPLKQCLDTLLRTAGGDGNLLFNVGPMLDGRIEARQVARLKEMGGWLAQHGDVVYGTRGGPYKPAPWGVATCKGRTVNLVVLEWPKSGEIRLPAPPAKIQSHKTLTGGEIAVEATADALVLRKGDSAWDGLAAIVALELDQEAFAIEPLGGTPPSPVKQARASNVFQNSSSYTAAKAFDGDPGTRWATDGGTTSAWIEFDLRAPQAVKGLRLIQEGEYAGRIHAWRLACRAGDGWQELASGRETKAEHEILFAPVTASTFRLSLDEATDGPTINEIVLVDAKG